MPLMLERIKPTGPEQRPFHEAMTALFSIDELNRLVKHRLAIEPEHIFHPESVLPRRVELLFVAIDRDDRWDELLLVVCLERPTSSNLLNVCCGLKGVTLEDWQKTVRQHLLAEALSDGFRTEVLQAFVQKLGRSFPPPQAEEPARDLVYRVVILAEEEGWAESLLQEAYFAEPSAIGLNRYLGFFLPQKARWLADRTTSAKKALLGLRDLIKLYPKVQASVDHFRGELKEIDERIKKLRDLKDLHYSLHQLETDYYAKIRLLSRGNGRAPDPDELLYLRTLRLRFNTELIPKLNSARAKHLFDDEELAWVDELHTAARLWSDYLEQRAAAEAMQTVGDMIELVLRNEPFKVNVVLVSWARELRIKDLVQILEAIEGNLLDEHLPATTLEPIHTGFLDLDALDRILSGLIQRHNQWQKLVQALQNRSLKNTRVAQLSWDHVKGIANKLLPLTPSEWAAEFHRQAHEIEDGLRINAVAKLEAPFQLIHTLVQGQFLQADDDLKSLCGKLCEVGESLSALLR